MRRHLVVANPGDTGASLKLRKRGRKVKDVHVANPGDTGASLKRVCDLLNKAWIVEVANPGDTGASLKLEHGNRLEHVVDASQTPVTPGPH